ncbi:disks large homolog 5 isoform X1 [Lutzomyia longipalpis]|uniref:disks large homolog 5 isoform X1 n=2 Tax=Lutzomyia longipalpis TaxID=7200 RepID=UPI002483F7FF|nr:disks large homolog 5 isoform X1 [Lutzomyia longipalpis]
MNVSSCSDSDGLSGGTMAASGDPTMENNGSVSPIVQDFGSFGASGNNNAHAYDAMKDQLDEAMTEISSLKRQYIDSKRRCDSAQERLEYYREQYTAAMNQLETAVQESSSLRANFAKSNSEKNRLEQKVHHLEKKLARIIESMKLENGNSQTICAFLEQYNELKKKYEQNKTECEKLVKDAELYKKKCDELIDEHNSLAIEKDELKHQLLMAIRQLDSVQRERDERSQQLKHNDDVIKGLNQVLESKCIELRRSTEQRNAAEQELSLILSEKDTVLKENQKLSDDLVIVMKKSTEFEGRYKEEKQALLYENERLKNELEASLHYREDLLKECESLRQTCKEQTLKASSGSGDHVKHADFKSTSNESWSKELTEEKDKIAQELEAAKQENEILRKSLDKARNEVIKASQDTDLAKSRRDWAITEREKIVQERDSVKILCDELRKERDTAISELLAAIRDSENIKKQKDEACREIEQLREHLEAQPPAPSRNSARWSCASYDVEPFRKMDTEIIDIDISGLPTDGELGLVLDGGRDDSQSGGDNGVYVVSVVKDSVVDGKLKPNDCIIQVNNLDCTSVSRRIVLESIRSSAPRCKVVVKRQLMNASHLYTATLNMKTGRSHGLCLESGIYISKIEPGSLAARDNNLAIGDRIISINRKALDATKSISDALQLLEETRNDTLVFVALKQIGQMNSNNRALMYNKMVNICTQTEEPPTRLSDKGGTKRGSIPVSNMEFPFKPAATPTAKSTSKITDLIKMTFRGKSQKNSAEAEETLTQENDAILLLDSVLNSENTSKSSVLKRSKRKKESKESKSMGTWPRANVIAHENISGTIVQNRKKERPALTLFTGALQAKEEKNNRKGEDYFESCPPSKAPTTTAKSSVANNPNRNSNPIPYHVQSPPPNILNRHSVYRSIEHEPIVPMGSSGLGPGQVLSGSGGVNTYARAPKYLDFERYQPHHHHHPNRMSLNLTPSDNSLLYNLNEKLRGGNLLLNQQQGQQNSLDIISLKSQNSIDSFLAPKSPPSLDPPTKPPSREAVDYYALKKMTRNVSKYPSDSENLSPDTVVAGGINAGNTSTLPSYSRFQSINAPPSRNQVLFPVVPIHPHHNHGYRHVSPLTLPPTAHSTDSTGLLGGGGSIPEKSEFDSYIPSYHHSHGTSIDYQYNKHRFQATKDRDDMQAPYSSGYEGGTFPRKKETPRFRIPSNPSVTSKGSGVKNSTGSIEHHGSERGSPMPTFQVEVLSHGSNLNKRNTMSDYCYGQKPSPGDLRRVTIDKSVEPLGITIRCNNNGGGIFVSTVTENSIASQVGLQTGDQLLEVCGLNMRSATYELAASVLRQCGNSMTMLVQYNPDSKYDPDAGHSTDEDENISLSGSSTPRNSPSVARTLQLRNQSAAKSATTTQQLIQRGIFPPSTVASSAQSKKSPFSGPTASPTVETMMKQSAVSVGANVYQEEPRMLIIETKKKSLGISFVGGNKTGIFVHRVQSESLGDNAGIRVGDQILEFNRVDLRAATAEQAWLEIAKSVDKVSVVVQHNMQKFNQIDPDQESIDSLYIKVAFDRTGDIGESDLRFVKDDVLYVDNTMFTGTPGLWRAWTLDEYGHRISCGLIPSQTKVEEEQRLHQDTTDADNTSRRSTTSARRSFFRRKKHQRSSSRDSKELASFSNTQLSWFSDSGMLNDETTINSYIRMERLDYPSYRPVLVLGPLAECVVDKLQTDFPKEFERCKLQPMNCSEETLEKNLHNNVYVDYRRRGNIFECTTIQAIKDVRDKKRHCILDICISAVDRVQRCQIYPIVLLLRFRSAKQIKEVKDSRYSTDKISAKAAKEMYEHALKLETDYGQFISAVIPAGVNIHHMSSQVKAAVEDEQKKVLWIPFSTNLAS